jgi:predicted nuclease of predicted toxin-antitoxin system
LAVLRTFSRGPPDDKIREYAAAERFAIVTAVSGFLDLAKSKGAPPKIVHLENCGYRTSQIESMLRRTLSGLRSWSNPHETTLAIPNKK